MNKLKSDKTETTFGRRIASGILAATMGFSCIATNMLGIADAMGMQNVVHAEDGAPVAESPYKTNYRSSSRGDYVSGETYYDIGTLYGHAYYSGSNGWTDIGNGNYQETGWKIYNVKSFLDADGDGYNSENSIVNTLPYTTDVNDDGASDFVRDKELMCWQVFATDAAYRNKYLERTDIPDFQIPTFDGDATPAYYIAKGTVTGEKGKETITWEIRSWVTDTDTWIDPDTFSKTDLTGLAKAIEAGDINGSNLENYFDDLTEKAANDELTHMWDKADFEDKESIKQPFTFGDTIDTWWKGVAANIYTADVTIEGTKTHSNDTDISDVKYHVDGVTDLLGKSYDNTLDFELKYDSKADASVKPNYNLANAISGLNPVIDLILSGSEDASSIGESFKRVTTDKGYAIKNTFDGTATYGTYINPSSMEMDMTKSAFAAYLNKLPVYQKCGVTVTLSDGTKVDYPAFMYEDGKFMVTGKALEAIEKANPGIDFGFGKYDTAKRYGLGDNDLQNQNLAVYLLKQYANGGYTYTVNGEEQVATDYWFFDNGVQYFADRLNISNTIATAVNKNVTDAEDAITCSSSGDTITFTFPNLSYLDTNYDRTTGHAIYPIVGLMSHILTLGSAARADLTAYYSTGYQRAGGTLIAERPHNDQLDTFAKTDDANNNTPSIGVASDTATITDTVNYTDLTPGTEYKLVGALYDVDTECAIKADGTISENKDVIKFDTDDTYAMASIVFTPTEKDGTLELTFNYDASKLAGHKIVVLEKLYLNNTKTLVATHTNKADSDQTVEIATPGMKTNATGEDNTSKSIDVSETTVINDLVTYNGLIPGKEYTLVAQPMNKEDSTAIGEPVQKTFTPESSDGSVTVSVTVDTSELIGKSIVMFETLKQDDVEVIVHADINDADQTVTVKAPAIKTVATADDNTSKFIDVQADAIIIDKVSYENLVPGEKYTLKAELFDDDGNKVKDIDTQDVTFTAEAENGVVPVNIKFDTRGQAGKSFTVVEYLIYNKAEIARHYDLTSEDQTVKVKTPTIKTAASAADDTTLKSVDCGTSAGILDRVSYTNLKDGQTYTLVASVYDKTTKVWVDNVATKEFKADSKVGYVDVNLTFDTSDKRGHELVIGETLYIDDVAIVTHKDAADKDQTVNVQAPEIKTVATGTDGEHIVDCTDDLTIQDTVSYKNLVVGNTYVMIAGLYDATAKEWIGDNVGTKTFTPATSDGEVVVEIKNIDTTSRAGHKLVVVETLKASNTIITEHNDLEDTNQTVTVKQPKINTVASASADSDVKLVDCYDSITIYDTVAFTDLVPGKEYTITASLWDATDDKSLGKSVGTKTFKPESANGNVVVEITDVDTHALANHKIVVFETLNYKDTTIATHEDKNDTDQTVTVKQPKIATKAYGSDKNKKIDCIANVTIFDDVMYENLTVGKTYTLVAGLYDINKGEYVGKEVSHDFVPASANGTETVEIPNVNTTALMGDSIVVVEKLVSNKIVYVNHDDLTDTDQTVTVKGPGIKTVAMNAAKDDKTIDAVTDSVIVDTVTLTDLAVGTSYEITVGLYDVDTEEYITGIAVDGSANNLVQFKATKADMEMDVKITVDTTERLGHKLVVVETLRTGETVVAEHTALTDTNQTVTVKTPTIKTHAFGADEKSTTIDCGKDVTIIDVVDYTGLAVGKTYTLTAGLRDAATGDMISTEEPVSFVPKTEDGSVKITINHVDTTKYIGGKIVVIESLKIDDKEIVNHDDIKDVDQTVTVKTPTIKTLASDKISKNKILDKSENAVIVDTVSYTDLVPGTEYTIRASVYDKSAGAMVDGVTASKTFTPTTPNGTVDVEITLDTTNMPSSKLVVFESLYESTTLIVDHSDKDDEDQSVTVSYPGIKTSASINGEKTALKTKDAVIEDTVTYQGLTPGKSYTMTAELRDKTTGDVIDGVSVAPVTFEPTSASGSVVVKITVDATALKNNTVVVFEYLTSGDETIAVHTDINDTDQTVTFEEEKHPTIDTVATNKTLDSHNISAYKQETIVDKITYTGLEANTAYDLKTVVYDITDKSAAKVKVAELDSKFTTKTGSEDTSVNITLDTTNLKGHTLVVAETVLLNGKIIVTHEDMSDEDQTVYVDVPSIHTNATSAATGTHTLERSKDAQIVDRVTYSGLVPGQKYTVTATPYYKDSGEAVKGVKPVTVEFTAEKADGYIDVTVPIDTTFLPGKSIVMFESLKYEDVEIAVHNDINDENQTVTVPTIDTVATGAGGSHTIPINEDVVVTDTITFTGLTVGKTYHIEGRLVHKKDSAKAVAEASMDFVPTETNGTVQVEYTFNTAGLANESFVCFETIKTDDDVVLIDHKDLNDEDQTVTVTDTPDTPSTGDSSKMTFHFVLSAIFGAGFIGCVVLMYRRRRDD